MSCRFLSFCHCDIVFEVVLGGHMGKIPPILGTVLLTTSELQKFGSEEECKFITGPSR